MDEHHGEVLRVLARVAGNDDVLVDVAVGDALGAGLGVVVKDQLELLEARLVGEGHDDRLSPPDILARIEPVGPAELQVHRVQVGQVSTVDDLRGNVAVEQETPGFVGLHAGRGDLRRYFFEELLLPGKGGLAFGLGEIFPSADALGCRALPSLAASSP